MKKLFAVLSCLLMILSLHACGVGRSKETEPIYLSEWDAKQAFVSIMDQVFPQVIAPPVDYVSSHYDTVELIHYEELGYWDVEAEGSITVYVDGLYSVVLFTVGGQVNHLSGEVAVGTLHLDDRYGALS